MKHRYFKKVSVGVSCMCMAACIPSTRVKFLFIVDFVGLELLFGSVEFQVVQYDYNG